MPTVDELLQKKDDGFHTIDQDATVMDAVKLMNDQGVGALVVTSKQKKLAGILSERDVLRRVVAKGVDPARTQVKQVMTREVVRCTLSTELHHVRQMMNKLHIRHIPVEDTQKGLCGMVSMRDLNTWQIHKDGLEIAYLTQFVYGVA